MVAVVFVVGMRRKTQWVLDLVRRAGRRMKPLVLRSAGSAGSPTAVVHHVGRTSGRAYETPVVATPSAGGFVVALPYGEKTDWLQNVLAAGSATIVLDGTTHDVVAPRVVAMDAVGGAFAAKEQRMHQRFRVVQALEVSSAARTGSSPAGTGR